MLLKPLIVAKQHISLDDDNIAIVIGKRKGGEDCVCWCDIRKTGLSVHLIVYVCAYVCMCVECGAEL